MTGHTLRIKSTILLPANDPQTAPCQACQSHSGGTLPSAITKEACGRSLVGAAGAQASSPRIGWTSSKTADGGLEEHFLLALATLPKHLHLRPCGRRAGITTIMIERHCCQKPLVCSFAMQALQGMVRIKSMSSSGLH